VGVLLSSHTTGLPAEHDKLVTGVTPHVTVPVEHTTKLSSLHVGVVCASQQISAVQPVEGHVPGVPLRFGRAVEQSEITHVFGSASQQISAVQPVEGHVPGVPLRFGRAVEQSAITHVGVSGSASQQISAVQPVEGHVPGVSLRWERSSVQ
jgi:hypothetical protein